MTEQEYTLSEMAKILNIKFRRIEKICREGLLSVASVRVKLERWKTERGWVTTHSAVRRFRQRLNDPLYTGESEAKGTEL